MSLMTIRTPSGQQGCGRRTVALGSSWRTFLWPLAKRYMACPPVGCLYTPESEARSRAASFMLCRTAGRRRIDASSTLIWIIPHRILSTGIGVSGCSKALRYRFDRCTGTVTRQSRRMTYASSLNWPQHAIHNTAPSPERRLLCSASRSTISPNLCPRLHKLWILVGAK